MDDGGGGPSEADTGGAGAACEAGAGSLREPSTARAGAAVSRAGAGSPRDASTATGGAACTAAGCTGEFVAFHLLVHCLPKMLSMSADAA